MSIWKKSSSNKFIALSALLVLAVVISVCIGSTKLDLYKAFADLFKGTSSAATRILLHVRLPRTLAALLCGGGLAVSGVLLQGVLQNSLAAPNIIGVNAGAGFATLLCTALLPTATRLVPWAGFAGALLCVLLVYGIALKSGASHTTLILAGVAVSTVVTAASNTIKLISDRVNLGTTTFFIGGLSGVTLKSIINVLPYIAVAVAVAYILAPMLEVLSLGDDTAQSLGLGVKRARFILLAVAALLAGAVVSFAGLVGFVGLIVPHIARRFFDANARALVAGSALMGMILVVVCDTVARVAFAPFELPVGILLSFIGGPFFVYLLLRGKNNA